jgi:hypothetical protein
VDQDQRGPGGYSSDLSGDGPTVPDQQQLSTEGNSRRNFLKAAVVASAAVATAGGAAGYALSSGRTPAPLLRFANLVASGSCISIDQGGKFSPNNPNNFIQLANSTLGDFGVDSGVTDPVDANSNLITLTRCGTHSPIYFKLVDSADSTLWIVGTIVESYTVSGQTTYSHVATNGGNEVSLALVLSGTQGTNSEKNEYQAHSCLQVQCSGPFAPSPN